jgi:hypothetical protein
MNLMEPESGYWIHQPREGMLELRHLLAAEK